MMNLNEIIIGNSYINIKNNNPYKVTSIGRHSETLEILVGYEDIEKNTWYRPSELFCLKFKRE